MQRTISVLVHGMSKTGKSTLAATTPKPLLYLDVEGGTRFLRMRKTYWEPLKDKPPVCDGTWDVCVVMVRDYDEVRQAYDWLNSGQHWFEAVALDSVSRLQGVLLEKITNREQAKMQDWGEIFRAFMGMIRDYHGLTTNPVKPISVCLVSESKADEAGVLHPFVQGQSKNTLPYVVDVLAAMEIVTWTDDTTMQMYKQHRMTTGPSMKYETGERVNGLIPPVLDNPTFEMMLDYVYGVEPSSAPAPAPVPNYAPQPVAQQPVQQVQYQPQQQYADPAVTQQPVEQQTQQPVVEQQQPQQQWPPAQWPPQQ